jgi:hypothetical protein
MATVNTGIEDVLFIQMFNGEISSVADESRSVYENSKGRFIKTTNYGQIWLDDLNRAVVAWDSRWRRVDATTVDVENALHKLFKGYGLDGFIK